MTDTAADYRSVEDREERIAEIDARVAEIDEEHANSLMPEDVRDEWNRLNSERDVHVATVAEVRKRKSRLEEITRNNPGAVERATTEAPAVHRKRGDEIYDLTRIRAEARSEEDHRAKLHDNAMRAIERAHFPAHGGRRETVQEHVEDLLARVDDRYGSFAKRVLATGSPVYDRAFGKVILQGPHTLTSEEQRQMALTPDTAGGFAVPFQLDPTVILTSDGSLSPLRQISRVEQITSKTWQGITSSGITVTRSGEGVESADESFTIAQPEVSPTRVIADVRFSIELDQDWSQLRSEISRLLLDAKEREEDAAFVTGDGTGNNPNGVVATLDATSEVEETTPGTFAVGDIFNVEDALPVRFRARASWLANKTTYNTIREGAFGSDGADLWVRLASGQPSELIGYPAFEASEMASPGPQARFLLAGDFSQFLIVDRLGMTVEVNPHVIGASQRWTGQRAVVAVWRNSSLILVDNAFRVLFDSTT